MSRDTPVLGDDFRTTPAATGFKHERDSDSQQIPSGAWGADIWACHENPMPNCLMATVCPCVSLAQIVTRVGWYPFSKTALFLMGMWVATMVLHMLAGMINFIGPIFDFGATAIVVLYVLFIVQLRHRMRERFQIPGTLVEDGVFSVFCSCCTIAQMATHVGSYTPGTCDFNPPDTLPGYE